MAMEINNTTYYLITEACKIAGISRGTLLLWIKKGKIKDAELVNRNGWRLFSEKEIQKIKTVAGKTGKAE